MIDTTPYIVVDNQKILPIGRTPQTGSSTSHPESRERQDFGVVDRVTISRQAREKCQQAQFDTAPPPDPAMLTYAPEKPR
jgi:hypothetical protein